MMFIVTNNPLSSINVEADLPSYRMIVAPPDPDAFMSDVAGSSLTLADATIGAELSEHPNSTNAILAISRRTQDKVFMTLSLSEVVRGLIKVLNWRESRGGKSNKKQEALSPPRLLLQAMKKMRRRVLNGQRGLRQRVVGEDFTSKELERGPERRPSGGEPPSAPNCGGILLYWEDKVNYANT
jgi:hypothetical protein